MARDESRPPPRRRVCVLAFDLRGRQKGPATGPRYTRQTTVAAQTPVRFIRRQRLNPKFMRNGLLMLVLVIGTAALLYTWINQGTTSERVTYGVFLTRVESAQVGKVTQKDNILTV